ncbi:hypothetical protein Adt_06027 [Abeliophyllum distichum]|uniref:Uncharacterized protein n=1 Tax=Abeliophyllum distichum TaxID=126358 RepID=A0ABD1V5S5_9LAMI
MISLVRGLVLNNEVYSTLVGFEGKFNKEEAVSKKLSEDLKMMSTKKAQLDSDNRILRFKLDALVSTKADLKARYEVELKAMKESLKQTRDQKKVAEASQKLSEVRAFTTETTVATANSNFEAMFAEKDKQLAEAKKEVYGVKAEQVEAKAKVVMSYKEKFPNTP